MTDDEVEATLTEVAGIGPWTAASTESKKICSWLPAKATRLR